MNIYSVIDIVLCTIDNLFYDTIKRNKKNIILLNAFKAQIIAHGRRSTLIVILL